MPWQWDHTPLRIKKNQKTFSEVMLQFLSIVLKTVTCENLHRLKNSLKKHHKNNSKKV